MMIFFSFFPFWKKQQCFPYVSVYINMPCMIIFVCSICTTNQAKKKIFLILSVQPKPQREYGQATIDMCTKLCTVCKQHPK